MVEGFLIDFLSYVIYGLPNLTNVFVLGYLRKSLVYMSGLRLAF